MKKLTIEDFIIRSRKTHGYKYDYSKAEYKNQGTKVCIICPEHGEFWQSPVDHWLGKGCPKCAKDFVREQSIKGSIEEFIQQANEKYDFKYEYSKVEYKGLHTKVCIICPEHGEFWQSPASHLNTQGCPKCGKYKNSCYSTEEFIQKATEKHNNKYDYNKTEFVDMNTKVCIICPEHGEFWQSPLKHLHGAGCPKCAIKQLSIKKIKSNKDEFIQKAKEVHGDKYDYNKVEYIDSLHKVCIICPEHGEFWQVPRYHLRGCGCPNCYGVRKHYKFNLLKEFESEYAFKAFLENNDPNILLAILNNICETDPKFNPIKKDIEKALENSDKEDPISKLENKYSSNTTEEEEVDIEEEEVTAPVKIDLDNEDQFDEIFGTSDDVDEEKELTIEDVINNTDKEIKIISKIDHLIAPELRKKIMSKLLNDKYRQWMLLNSK